MRGLRRNLFKAWSIVRRYYPYIIGALFLYGIFFINTFHESYPDEFDNILGGRYILEGKVIYKDFFTHHGPVSYFIAALALLFSGNSFVDFRVVYSILLFLISVGGYLYLRWSIGEKFTQFYIALLYVVAVTAVYFWGHMLLADSISAFFLLPVFALLLLKTIYNKALTLWDVFFVGTLSILTFFSSLSYAFLVAGIGVYTLYYFLVSQKYSYKNIHHLGKIVLAGLIFISPVTLYLVYLLATGSAHDYFFQNFTFNQKYYIYNYPRAEGVTGINPVRYMVIIMYNFLMNFTSLLIQVKDFNFNFPYNITLALGSTTLILYLLFTRKWTLAAFTLFMLVFSNVRSNPLESKETDYQSAVYMVFSLFSILFMVQLLYRKLQKEMEQPKKVIFSVAFLILTLYGAFTAFYLLRSFATKVFGKYMGTAPRIIDRAAIAPLMNDITEEEEMTWVGPFEFEELIYLDRPIASRYQIFNPGMGEAEEVHNRLIEDFETNKPKVIWFDKRFHILGRSPESYGQKFLNYLDTHYTTLYDYRDPEGRRYIASYPFEERVDIETKLYIRKENIEEILNRLLSKGYISVAPNE